MATRLTQLRVDEVSAVDKAANAKRFLILKRAPVPVEKMIKQEGDKWCLYSADGTKKLGTFDSKQEATDRLAEIEAFKHSKVAKTTLLGWVAASLRKAAGHPGPDTEVDEMTAEEIQKAVADGAAEALAPINERIAKLEAAAVAVPITEVVAAPVAKADEVPVVTPVVPDAVDAAAIAKMVKDGIVEAIAPIEKRLLVVETAQGARQSSLDEGAHKIVKNAGDMWEGSGLLV